jgi:hypothetical protein
MTNPGNKALPAVTLFLFAMGEITTASRAANSVPPDSSPTQPAANAPGNNHTQPEVPPSESDLKTAIVVHGKVVGPGDRPVAKARLFISANWTDPIDLGSNDANGAYRFALPEKSFHQYMDGSPQKSLRAALIAVADGLGAGWVNLSGINRNGWERMQPDNAQTVRLDADYPIAGRVVGLDGKSVVGATVAVSAISSLSDPKWDKLRTAIEAGNSDVDIRLVSHYYWDQTFHEIAWSAIKPATTDSDGRFKLASVGRNRLAQLNVSGPGIRQTHGSVLTRDDVGDFTAAVRARFPHTYRPHGYFYPDRKEWPDGEEGALLFDPSPTIEVDPARTVTGIVRDAQTGEPIPDARLVASNEESYPMSEFTDREGRYNIVRGDDSPTFWLYVEPRESDRNLTEVRRIDGGSPLGNIVANVDLPRGVIVSGRVVESGIDRAVVSGPRHPCGAPWPGVVVAGWVHYYPLSTNAALRGTPTGKYYDGGPTRQQNYSTSVVVGGDGRYRIAVPPGPGVLVFQSGPGNPDNGLAGSHKESDGFHRLYPYVALEARTKHDADLNRKLEKLRGFTGPIPVSNAHAYRMIDPPKDARVLDVTLEVPRVPSRVVRFGGPDGDGLSGLHVHGLVDSWMMVILDGSEAEVIRLEPATARQVTAFSADKKLGIKVGVVADPQPMTVQLQPVATIKGRIVDENGKPLTALLSAAEVPFGVDTTEIGFISQSRCDAEGRFEIVPLLAGQRYTAKIRGGISDTEEWGKAFENVVLRPGEVRDFGDIHVKLPVATQAAKTQ